MAEYEPLVIERAEGCRLFDIDGRAYLDGASSMWCNVHGHRHPRIDAAIREQLDRVAHCTSLGMGCDTTVRLAKRLAEIAPGNLEHVFFSSDGSSAVEVALKMAFQYWRQCANPQPKKTKFIALGEAYHGDTIGSASVGGIARFHALFEPLLFDVIRVPMPDPRRLPGTSLEAATAHFLDELEAMLQAHHEEVAAMVIEPLVQCAAGMIMHPPGYLRGVRELTKRYDVLLDRRRNRRRLGPHGHDVRLRAGKRRARFSLPGQRALRRLSADGRDADQRRNLQRIPRRVSPSAARCTTATRSAAIRWLAPPRSHRSMCSTRNKRCKSFRRKSRDSPSISADWPNIRTWPERANAD